MKKLLLFFAFVLITQGAFAVAIERITSNSVRFYNYSQSNFNMVGMFLTVNNMVYLIDTLNIKKSGPLDVAAGARIEFDGLTIPNSASIALWYSSAFPNNQNAGNIASFIQFGAAGHPYEAIADAAGIWTTGTFVAGAPPFIRDGDYTSWGAGNWNQGLTATEFTYAVDVQVYPNPFTSNLNLVSETEQIQQVWISDATGKVYFDSSPNRTNSVSFDATPLKQGTYLLHIRLSNGEEMHRRLLKI